MVVGEVAEPVDLLVVGGGPGGYVAALRAAQLGRSVTLVERSGVAGLGGSCLHVGCIPSKAILELASARHHLARPQRVGLRAREVSVDLGDFQRWRQDLVSSLAAGVGKLLTSVGVRVVAGNLRFNGRGRAAVETTDGNVLFFEFRDVVIATGSRPLGLDAVPFDGEFVLDSEGALALDFVPRSTAIIGGGYIGVELATALSKLGSDVTIIEAAGQLLPAPRASPHSPGPAGS